MPDLHDTDKSWTGPASARHFIVWIILWILIGFVIITWIFYREEGVPLMKFFTTSSIAFDPRVILDLLAP